MVGSQAPTVSAYLKSLSPEQREVISAVRALVSASLPPGFEERMQYGMISWVVPTSAYDRPTYNGQPIAVCSLAAQKHGYSLYMMGCYGHPDVSAALQAAYTAAGKRLDMGKSCLRFRRLDDLLTDAVGAAVGAATVADMIAMQDAAHAHRLKGKPVKKAGPKKKTTAPTKKAATKKAATKKAATKKAATNETAVKKTTAKKTATATATTRKPKPKPKPTTATATAKKKTTATKTPRAT